MNAGAGNDVVHGGDGNDHITGGLGSNTLYGENDNDSFSNLGWINQNDIADGGAGNDAFSVFWLSDPTITTGTGSDTIQLLSGNDGHRVTVTDFTAGSGGDVLDINSILSLLSGWDGSTNPFAAGFLRLVQNGANTDLQRDSNGATGGTVWTTIVTLQNVSASSLTVANFAPGYPPDGSLPLGQIITGTSGTDNLTGTPGDDTINALGGADFVNAGAGNDVVHGGDGNDHITGGLGSNTLYGENDNDSFSNLGWINQNDIADGGAGNDAFSVFWLSDPTITTGTGSDTIQLLSGNDGHRVTVTDFTAGSGGDVLDINSILSLLSGWDGSTNPFAAGFLRLVQNGANTDLQRDSNGATGGTVWTTIVTLQNVSASSLTVANFAPGYSPDGTLPTPPVATINDHSVNVNQWMQIDSWLSYSDANGSAATQYQFYDAGAAAGSGYFWTADVGQRAANTYISVAADDLDTTWVRSGQTGGSDLMWVRAFDGTDWSAWDAFTLTTLPNTPPQGSINDLIVDRNQWVKLDNLINTSDANGDAITQYQFYDAGAAAGSGYFWTADVGQRAANTYISVAADDLDTTWVRGGQTGGSDLMWVRAFDGTDWSAWDAFTLTTSPNTPPQVSINDLSVNPNQWINLDNLINTSDANGDAITHFQFYDAGAAAGSGYFWTADVGQRAANTYISVSADDLDTTWVRSGQTGGPDLMWVRAFDGTDWSAWDAFSLLTF